MECFGPCDAARPTVHTLHTHAQELWRRKVWLLANKQQLPACPFRCFPAEMLTSSGCCRELTRVQEEKTLMLSCFNVVTFSRFHVVMFSCFHCVMLSCLHVMLSCLHVMFSCFLVVMLSCFHGVMRMFFTAAFESGI